MKPRLEGDLRVAAKAQDAVVRDTIRLVLAAVHNEEVARRRELSDEEVTAVLSKQAKMRRESMEAFAAGGREDLVAKERAELSVIERYLPQQMSREEIRALAAEAIAETGATSRADQGRVMQRLMPKVRGRAEGKAVSEVVGELLGGKP